MLEGPETEWRAGLGAGRTQQAAGARKRDPSTLSES